MAATPESKVKHMVKELFAHLELAGCKPYVFWPVPSGYGPSSLDCLVCYYGIFIGIETKAPGGKPTPRQEFTISQINAAKGVTLTIDGRRGIEELEYLLLRIKACYDNRVLFIYRENTWENT